MGTGTPATSFQAGNKRPEDLQKLYPDADMSDPATAHWAAKLEMDKAAQPKTSDSHLKGKGMNPDATDQRLRDALAMRMRNQGIGRRATFLGGFGESSSLLGRY